MQPGRQWSERIELWIDAIKKQIYKPLGEVEAEVLFTMEELSAKEALEREFARITPGTSWGKKWEYAWFRFRITLPEEISGKRIVCVPDVGAESLCYMKKQDDTAFMPRGAYDKQHKEILLSLSANNGEKYDFLLEAYAGHGPRLENGGPVPMEVTPVEEPPVSQCKIGHITYGVWQEEAYQLYLDAFVLWDLYKLLDAKSLRAMQILEGLKAFTMIADVELTGEERLESFIEARKVLAPLLACKNGSTAPLLSMCGQSHLDLAWLWPYAETRRKTARTYSNQLTLMEEYPEYQFLSCDPFVIEILKEKYPEVYEVYLDKVNSGNMIPEGVMYVEPDVNMICGEALFRHIIEGVKRFDSLTGKRDVKMLWLPDVFGFTGALPQIMKQCGIPYFATQKLMRQDPEAEAFPYNDFLWEGIDGSRVLAHIYMKNNAQVTPKNLYDRWYKDRKQETGMDGMLAPFGFGDGGGGPVRDHIEIAKRVQDLEGLPRTIIESPVEYFKRIQNNSYKKPVYRGELYLAWHRGTLTAQSDLKIGNRYAETAIKEAETAIAMTYVSDPKAPIEADIEQVRKLWDKLLFLQFHDILPGSSIQRVNEEARRDFKLIIDSAGSISAKYEKLCNQYITKNTLWNTANIKMQELTDGFRVENSSMNVKLTFDGTVESIVSSKNRKEYLHSYSNVLRLYKNVNSCYDAWEIGSMVFDEEVKDACEIVEKIHLVEQTQEYIIFSYKMKIAHSLLEQRIIIRAQEAVIYFETVVDWHERHKLLKVCFYPDIHTGEGIEEIQYGYIKRSFGENHQFEKDQYEVCNHRYAAQADDTHGFAILNDGKYGVHVADKEISLSLLRAPVIPDQSADEGFHRFTYACMIYDGAFAESKVTNQGISLQHRALHHSIAKGEEKWNLLNIFDNGDSSIILDWCYKSSKHKDMIVLRIYQSMNQDSDAEITLPFDAKEVWEITPFEERLEVVSVKDKNKILVSCKPFEIKTLGIWLK